MHFVRALDRGSTLFNPRRGLSQPKFCSKRHGISSSLCAKVEHLALMERVLGKLPQRMLCATRMRWDLPKCLLKIITVPLLAIGELKEYSDMGHFGGQSVQRIDILRSSFEHSLDFVMSLAARCRTSEKEPPLRN